MTEVDNFKKDLLNVKIFNTRQEMGKVAAEEGISLLKKLLFEKETVRVIFAAAPSQNEFLEKLSQAEDIDWNRIVAFHMDEYVNLDAKAPQGFGNFLKNAIFSKVPFKEVHYLDGNQQNLQKECERYTELLSKQSIDIVFLGIGENGHIAFNDPDVADFNDEKSVKVVELDNVCREQQVHDGCFNHIEDVPKRALTLTVPMLASANYHFCIVPSKTKAEAVNNTINGPIDVSCPASILRTCSKATLYLDNESSKYLK